MLAGAPLRIHDWVVSLFSSLARYALTHPRRVLGIAALVTLAAALGLGRLKLRTDGQALVPQGAPAVRYDQAIRQQFGIEDNLVVLVRARGAEGIFNPATMQLVRELTAELGRLPGVESANLMSLATEPSFRMRPGTQRPQTLLEPPLKTRSELDQLREDLRKIELYTGTLVSGDGQSTAILIGVPQGADRARLYREVLKVIDAKRSRTDGPRDEIEVTGAPVAESLLGTHILEDLGIPSSLLGAATGLHAEPPDGKRPASFRALRGWIAGQIGLVPLAIAVMMLVFLVSFRNVLAALLAAPGILATLLFVFGVMGWLGVPVYLTTVVMPVLLTATGVTNDIYLFNRYFTLLRESDGRSPRDLLGETFDRMVSPVASTSLTTTAGFLSFGFSPLGPVRAFGICTGVGVLFGLLCSLTVVPALLSLVNPAWLIGPQRSQATSIRSRLNGFFSWLGLAVVRQRWLVAGLVVMLVALTPLGLRRLVVQDSWTDGFDPDSKFRRVTQQVNEDFYGMHLLYVSCDAAQVFQGEVAGNVLTPGRVVLPAARLPDFAALPGCSLTISPVETNSSSPASWQTHIAQAVRQGTNLMLYASPQPTDSTVCGALAGVARLRFEVAAQSHLDPQIIQALDELGNFIRSRSGYGVGGVLDPADYLRTTRFLSRPDDPTAKALPANAGEARVLWDYYRYARGPRRLRQVVDASYSQSLTTIFLKNANFRDTERLMSDIRAYEHEHLAPKGIKLGFAGDVAASQALIAGIVTTQLQSLSWSIVGIGVITAVLGGSWRWGLYCVLPSLLAVLLKFAVMGWADIPLGVATSMFAAMTLGIGVNCAIQFLESHAQAGAGETPRLERLRRAMILTGPPALINTLAVSLGFGVLLLSQVPANARLGLLMVLSLVNCLIASLLILPVLLYWWPVKNSRRP